MKKKIALFSFVLVLVCAVLAGCAVSVFNKNDNTGAPEDDVNLSTATASVPYIKDAAADKTFLVSASNPQASVKVFDSLGNLVAITFEKTKAGNFVVAPAEEYTAGATYSIKLSDDASFAGEFYGYDAIDFSIAKAEVYNVDLKEDVVVLEYGTFAFDESAMKIYTAEKVDVTIGGYVVAPISDKAYNAYRVDAIAYNGGRMVLSVSDPESLDQVFGDIEINKTFVLSDGEFTFNEDALVAVSEEMFPSLASWTDNFKIEFPEKSVDKDNNTAKLYIKVSFTYKGISAYILIANDISFSPTVNYSVIPFSAQVGADITVVTTTTLGVVAGYSIDKQWAVDELMKKINDSEEASFTHTLAKLAHWQVNYGPLGLAYDLDIVLTVSLKGELDASCVIVTNYDVGAYYVDGDFKAWCDKGESSGFKMNEIELYGVIGAKIGFNNALELSIIQIAKVGIEVELGFYVDIWGCVKVVFEDGDIKKPSAAAGIYGDFGFYVDIKLVASAGIPGIEKLQFSKGWTLFSKKWSIFTFGNPELDVCFIDKTKELVLTGTQGAMPTMDVKVYNMISRTYSTKTVAYADCNITLPAACYFVVNNDGVLTLKEDAPAAFGNGENMNQEVIYKYDGHGLNNIVGSVFVVKVRNMPYAITSVVSFDKNNPKDVVFSIDLMDATYEGVEGIDSQYVSYKDGSLFVDQLALVSKDSGRFEFYVKNSKNTITLWVDVYGVLGLKAIGRGTAANPYIIFGKDQLTELSSAAAAYNYYNGIYFRLANDISYNGNEFTPIPKFQGTLDGNGHAITNLSINSLSGDYAGFILRNEGTIKNLSVSAIMNFNNRVVYAGVIAAVNAQTGIIDNCTASGSITVAYKTGLNSHADMKVGGAVGINEGTVKNVASYTGITAEISGTGTKSNIYLAGVIGQNSGSISDSAYYATINASSKSWHKLHKSDLYN